ncbi:hypothetical protein CUMW_062690 [Citrus unshiu]|nr:hypothetical protein CUMW_062690 [Citrus unshiu]
MENGNLTYIPHQEHLSIFKHVSCCNDSRNVSIHTLKANENWDGGVVDWVSTETCLYFGSDPVE